MAPDQSSLQQTYAQELKPILEELEVARLHLRNRVFWSIAGTVPLIAAAGYVLGPIGCFLGTIGALIVVFRFNQSSLEGYRSQFKQRIVQRLVKYYNPSFHYGAENGISATVFNNSQIFSQKSDRYHCEDLVSGKIGSTRFRFSEIHAEYKTKSKDGRKYQTLFSGLFFVADFNKFFKGTTIVIPDAFGRMGGNGTILEGIGSIGRINIGKAAPVQNRSLEHVKLEDPTFERLFQVYSTDQVEARYILSTSLIERLVKYCQTADNPKNYPLQSSMIWLSFVNSSVHIAIPTFKNHFEPPSIFKGSALLTLQDMNNYLMDIQLAEEIIETLNLNTRIWGKH